jgi:nucleotide-binding universal stress UspA family protein
MASGPLIVGVDLSDESLAALRVAMETAGALGAQLTVVHAVGLLDKIGYRAQPPLDELVAAAREAVGAPPVHVEVVTDNGPAADVLLRVAERAGATMIVVGRRGLGAAPRLLGSVSEAVLTRATTPVLVVPVPD